MALNFPITPEDGDTYQGYVYDATAGVWNSDPHQIASRFVTSATAPSSPSEGDGWFDTNTAKSYVYYDGGWVQLGALGTVDLNQIADVTVSTPVNGESLVYDGTDWVNQSVDIYDVDSSSTGYFSMPKGTDAQRPVAPNNGDIRFNTERGNPEWYSEASSSWVLFKDGPTFDVQYLVIAGGAGGGSWVGGGGGAGGYRSSVVGESSGGGSAAESTLSLEVGAYTVTVGAGGAGSYSTSGTTIVTSATNGFNSVFGTITSLAGGRGGSYSLNAVGSGGSGGGGSPTAGGFGTGATNQGFAGGSGTDAATYSGGGGGGASQVGATGNNDAGGTGGKGGDGVASSITGSSVFRAGGGGGGVNTPGGGATAGAGGTGGGGAGAISTGSGSVATNGTVNTGGGGGGSGQGGSTPSSTGGTGGSGIVILKYPSLYTATPTVGLTSITNTVGDYKVTQFTAGTGTVTFS